MVEFFSPGYVIEGGYLEWILHAHGGIVGQFDGWRIATWSRPLFLTGELNYGPNDVWFLARGLSTQASMTAANVSDALVLASAGNVDAAFAAGDRFAGQPQAALSDAQRAFLQSAATIQRLERPRPGDEDLRQPGRPRPCRRDGRAGATGVRRARRR